ncbi:energy-coupling factor ABC transporter ATP-binding protein [Nigerium massiliense]|uniref:energy-coupling factor ABC transporter ATP-binding protein n=1 Tax=Nigerium massiliense TaxID=1522317 RepID=UPI00058D074D|nr:ATP-binding cassette domain-containing protein [Nigerium massiliense]
MTALLAALNLDAGYPGRPVLQGASLELTAGRRTVLLGANGSGKTTLLRCLAAAHHPDRGRIEYDGVPLASGRDALRTHRRRVQLVLQDPDDQLFSADVTQDVSFGPLNMGLPEDEVRARVAEALDVLGVAKLAERATHQLSYGERKRVAVAGAVAMRPGVLLLDEPTAGLDPVGVSEMIGALERLGQRGTTIVIATHDVDLALAWADEAAVVEGGRVTTGPVVDVLSDPGLLDRAHLRRPWPLEVVRRLGIDAAPRCVDDVVTLLSGEPRRP